MSLDKQYNIKFPKKVFSGLNSIEQIRNIVTEQNASKICLMTDSGVFSCGIVDRPLEILKECKVEVLLINTISPEPSISDINSIYSMVKDFNAEIIIAIGGGSVMDTAKLMSAALPNPKLMEDIRDTGKIKNPAIKTVMIPTSSGTGAEVSANAIVLFPEEKLKVGIVHESLVPYFVILDANVTANLPPKLTASTGVDALCHALESYISLLSNPFCELFATKSISLICENIEKSYQNGSDMQARVNMQLASFYGGLCLATSSTVAVHALSYPLGGKFHIPHGVSNAILLPYVMDANLDAIRGKLTHLAPIMLPYYEKIPVDKYPEAVIQYLFQLMESLNIPNNLVGFGVKRGDLDFLVESAMKVTRLLSNNPKKLTREEIRQIYLQLL